MNKSTHQEKPRVRDRSQEAEISEVFSSLQGEGPYLGVKQIFIRFGRCNMHCAYCDELEKMREEAFSFYSIERLSETVDALEREKGAHHSISLTGGEPLFYTAFLKNFLPQVKAQGKTVYLETNGTLPQELERVIDWCDIIAMDMKPSSSTQDRSFYKEHVDFLKIALRKEVFIKTVVTPDTRIEDIAECVSIIKNINPNIPFIFQPLSEAFGINVKAIELIEKHFFEVAKKSLSNVRVIPQMHKIWGVR